MGVIVPFKHQRKPETRWAARSNARYRQYAEDAQAHADRAWNPVEKKAWRRMAEKWLKLVDSERIQGTK
jgi:hypothetical protein